LGEDYLTHHRLPGLPQNNGTDPVTPGDGEGSGDPNTGGDPSGGDPSGSGGDPSGSGGDPSGSGGDPSGSGGDPSGSGGDTKRKRDAHSLEFPQLIYRRQSNSTAPAGNDTIKDLTKLVVSNVTAIDYNDVNIKANPYNRTDFEFTLMVDQGLEYLITSCSNGNVYVQGIEQETPDSCSDLWAAQEDITATDGSERIMHYYNNTMDVVGVSRLRVASKDQLPKQSVPVALAPIDLSADPNAACTTCAGKNETLGDLNDNTLYFAVDMFENIFFTAVCTYLDNSVPKLFVINDVDAGLAMLKSPDIEYSVTGGKVDDCFVLPLVQGSDDPNSYEVEDKTDEDGDDDSLNLDWDSGEAEEV
jgi:hypothetical protein